MSTNKIVVLGGCSVFDRKGTQCLPGTVLSVVGAKAKSEYRPLEVTEADRTEWNGTGYTRDLLEGEVSAGANPQPVVGEGSARTHLIPGVPVPSSTNTVNPDGVGVGPAGQPVAHPKSLWNLDPASLADKTVEELNAMVGERLSPEQAAQWQPISDPTMLIQTLSRDFVPSAPAGANVATAPAG